MRKDFWVTNRSNRNVSLGDLNLTIKAYACVNLLDSRHYHYTLEQLENSIKSGSLFIKRDKIIMAHSKVNIIPENKFIESKSELYIYKKKSSFELQQKNYEELSFEEDQKKSDEKFAEESLLDETPKEKK